MSDEKSKADEKSRVKVTDKRLFRPDGELREEYSFLKEEPKPDADSGERTDRKETEREERNDTRRPAEAGREDTSPPQPGASQARAGAAAPGPGAPSPGEPGPGGAAFGGAGEDRPSFLDLASVLAEPVAVYLGDVQLPDGKSAENLELARFHIDLLEVLKDKTAGNLTAQESSVLEELLYRLRMRYVQKRG